jgi:hypothetical protein
MEFNKYQSTLEELQIGTYPQEVQNEFFEAINGIPYIASLISANRPYVQNLPKDEKGRAIIDLSNPPIVEDVDYFRPTAIHYQQYGCLTNLRPNANPNSEFGKWFYTELDRIWNGMTRPDGAWITGDMYFYLNYCPIVQSKIRKGTKVADRVVDLPEFWEGVDWRFKGIEKARNEGHHFAEIAKRGASKSYCVASVLAKLFVVGENKENCQKVRALVMAYQKEYLTKDGTLNKFVDIKDFLTEQTQFPSKMLKRSLQEMQWKMGYIDVDTGIEKGTQNEVMGVSSKDDPDKARGKRASRIIIEEFGNFPKIADTYRVILPSVQEGDIVFGQIISIGTGGSEGADFAGAQEMIYNPLGYNILALRNVYDKGSQGKGTSIFFFGAPVNRKGCYNHDGISDVTKAVLEICNNRYQVKYNSTDPMALTRTKAENPLTLQEAIMRRDSTMFPVASLQDRINQLQENDSIQATHYTGTLTMEANGIIKFVPTADQPIRYFPHKDNKNCKGAIEIIKMPERGVDGKVFGNRYLGGIDPYNDDSSETVSLGSIFILDLWTDSIVAEYTGRPTFADDFYEICRLLLLFYNARANYENNCKGLFAYFSRMNCLYLLTDTLEFLKDKDMVKGGQIGNKLKGTRATEGINNYGRTLIRNWLIKECVRVVQEGDETKEISVYNLFNIENIALLMELAQWNPDGNFDRVSAMGMLMLLREDRLITFNGNLQGSKKTTPQEYDNEDSFFTKNYDGKFGISEEK